MTTQGKDWVPLLKSLPYSDRFNSVSEGAQNLFVRLLAQCDDAGSYYFSPKLLLAMLYPLMYEQGRISLRTIKSRRDELLGADLCVKYTAVSDGKTYLRVKNCVKGKRKNSKIDKRFPEESETNREGMLAPIIEDNIKEEKREESPLPLNPILKQAGELSTLYINQTGKRGGHAGILNHFHDCLKDPTYRLDFDGWGDEILKLPFGQVIGQIWDFTDQFKILKPKRKYESPTPNALSDHTRAKQEASFRDADRRKKEWDALSPKEKQAREDAKSASFDKLRKKLAIAPKG